MLETVGHKPMLEAVGHRPMLESVERGSTLQAVSCRPMLQPVGPCNMPYAIGMLQVAGHRPMLQAAGQTHMLQAADRKPMLQAAGHRCPRYGLMLQATGLRGAYTSAGASVPTLMAHETSPSLPAEPSSLPSLLPLPPEEADEFSCACFHSALTRA